MAKWEDRGSSAVFEDREDIIFQDTEPSSSSSSRSSSGSSSSSLSSSGSSAMDHFTDFDDVWESTIYDMWKKDGVIVLPSPTGLKIIP